MHILDIVDIDNMAAEVDDETLARIGASVCEEYEVDKASMGDWLERNQLALELTNMKKETVNEPWPGASNTKLPLVLNAAMRVSAEEHAEIMRGSDIVKAEILGKHTEEKEARSIRVKERMNYQFYHELDDWDDDHDKLILAKNISGTVHKKVFYADSKIQCVLRRNGVVINDNVEKIQDAPRVTDEIDRYWWEVEEKVREGSWEEIDITGSDDIEFAESDKPNRFLEQIRREDLDDDGYPEPYVVTVHERTQQVVRISPNFTPESIVFNESIDVLEYQDLSDAEKDDIKKQLEVVRFDTTKARLKYVKYEMVPSWEGGYWGFGFGVLLGPLNDNCNKLINQLINAGTLSIRGGGFINSGIKMAGGELKVRWNEWKKVQSPGMDLGRNIVPFPIKEPSQTLFSLLGLLMDVLRELSSVSEVMSGEQPKANMAASSIDMLIEQGRKLFNSVYKRHYRSLTKEQKAVFDLNFLYQDPAVYADLLDIPQEQAFELSRQDFSMQGLDIVPTANPEFSSKARRMAEVQALLNMADDPDVDGKAIKRMFVEVITDDLERAEELVPDEPQMTPAQMQEQMQLQMEEFKASTEARKLEAQAKIAELELQKLQLEIQIEADKAPVELRVERIEADRKEDLAQVEREIGVNKIRQSEIELTKAGE